MGEKKVFLLADYDFLNQMHDEIIDDIIVTDNHIELVFNSLHFPHIKNYKKARIIFDDLEDVNCDAYVRIYFEKQCIIEKGEVLYIDEFIKFMEKEKIKLEVIDIMSGYNLIMIQGQCIDSDNSYRDENFQLVISTEKISYFFSD